MVLKRIVMGAAAVLFACCAVAADKLAIAEPINKGGMNAQDIEAVWSMLEASVDGGYELISRAALKSIMTEIGLTTSSGLVNMNSAQSAKLGEIKAVKYLLVPTVSKFGSRLNLSLVMVDSSTGSIDPKRKASETFQSLDEMADKLKDTLAEIGLGTEVKKRGRSAVLSTVVRAPGAPPYAAEEFNTLLEASLLNNGVRLQNMKSVYKILKKNNIDNPSEVEPAMNRRIGELLRVDYLIRPHITRYSCRANRVYIAVTRSYQDVFVGDLEGFIRIDSAQDGEVAATIPFRLKLDFSEVENTDNWTPRDYERHLIDRVMPAVTGAVLKTVGK